MVRFAQNLEAVEFEVLHRVHLPTALVVNFLLAAVGLPLEILLTALVVMALSAVKEVLRLVILPTAAVEKTPLVLRAQYFRELLAAYLRIVPPVAVLLGIKQMLLGLLSTA